MRDFTAQLHLRVRPADLAMAHDLARRDGRSLSEIVRALVAEAAARLDQAEAPRR